MFQKYMLGRAACAAAFGNAGLLMKRRGGRRNARALALGCLVAAIALPLAFAAVPVRAGSGYSFQVDPTRSGLLHGAGLTYWDDNLWGVDLETNQVWAYDGEQVRLGGALPEGILPEGILCATQHGMFALGYDHALTVGPGDYIDRSHTVILKSDDGFSDFRPVESYARAWRDRPTLSALPRSMVELDNGHMLYLDYVGNCNIYHSDDGGETWNILMSQWDWANPNIPEGHTPIKHFHGGIYDDQTGNLYVMTGDESDSSQPSILVCDDLYGPEGLIQNPGLWQNRWGLLENDRPNLDLDYTLHFPDGTATTQAFRATDMVVRGDYIYWGMDSSYPEEGGVGILRADRYTGQVERIGLGTEEERRGPIYHTLKSSEGDLLLFNSSAYQIDQEQYRNLNDEYLRIYRVSDDGETVVVLAKFRRSDWEDPIPGPASDDRSLAKFWGYEEAFGYIWLSSLGRFEGYDGIIAGQIVPGPEGDFDGDCDVDGKDFLKWQQGESPNQLSASDLAAWELNFGTTGPIPEGDFDGDGDVDGKDFLKWQQGKSPNPFSASDLAVWELNFGTTGSITPVSVAVPEPATGLMLMLGMAVMLLGKHAVQNDARYHCHRFAKPS